MSNLVNAFKLFLDTNELGATDTRKLNSILEKLDDENKISKEDVLFVIAKSSKDKDGSYRNFVSRIIQAISLIKEEATEDIKDVVNTLNIEKIKRDNKDYLKFYGEFPQLPNTVISNINYAEDKYIQALGTDERLNIFISYSKRDENKVNLFQETLKSVAKSKVITWTMVELVHGIDFDKQIKNKLNSCDYGFAMVSENFLDSEYIKEVELKKLLEDNILFPILLEGKFSELRKKYDDEIIQKLFDSHIFYLGDRGRIDSFSDMHNNESRKHFIDEVINALEKRKVYDLEQENVSRENHLNYINSRKEYNSLLYINSQCSLQHIETSLEKTLNDTKGLERKINLQEDMVAWLKEKNTPIYALLGEYGVGKTFNTRMFASKLQELRKKNIIVPYSIYIDLRDTPTFIEKNGSKRQVTLEELISEILRLSNNKELCAEKIVEDSKNGKAIIIFDGLDEKLVHYSKDMKNKFLREIINIIDVDKFNTTNQKIVISCRTHYFESIKEQNSFLRDNERFDLGKINYRAVEVLPFSLEQIKSYIKNIFPSKDIPKLMGFISSDQYLESIIKKPLMLNKLSAILPKLVEEKKRNRRITSRLFYSALIDDTLARDNEKHTISIRDKKRLLKEISFMFYTKGIQSIDIDKLNDWLNTFIYDTKVFKKYQNKDFDLLELDLRNSTLLVRFGEKQFGFSHTSFYEYFISEYIIEHWEKFEFSNSISQLTKEFVIEGIQERDDYDRNELIEKILITLEKETTKNKRFALDIFAQLEVSTKKIYLDSQVLDYYKFEKFNCKEFKIFNSSLYSAEFSELEIEKLIIKNSNLNESMFDKCNIKNISKDEKSFMNYITDTENIFKNNLDVNNLHNFPMDNQIKIESVNIHPSKFLEVKENKDRLYTVSKDCIQILEKDTFYCEKSIYCNQIKTIDIDDNYIYCGCHDGLKILSKKDYKLRKSFLKTTSVQLIANSEKNIYEYSHEGIKIFDKKSFDLKMTFYENNVNAIQIIDNEIYCCSENTIKIWNESSFEMINELTYGIHKGMVVDSEYMYVLTNERLYKISRSEYKVDKYIYSFNHIVHDDKYLYVCNESSISILDKNNLNIVYSMSIVDEIKKIYLYHKNLYLIRNRGVYIFNTKDKIIKKSLLNTRINSLFHDESSIYSISEYGFKVWNKINFNYVNTLFRFNINTINSDEKYIYLGFNNYVEILNKNDYTHFCNLDEYSVKSICVDEYIYIGTNNGVKVYNKDEFKLIAQLDMNWVNEVEYDENFIYAISNSYMQIWDKKTFKKVWNIKINNLNCIKINNKYIFLASFDNLYLIDKINFKIEHTLSFNKILNFEVKDNYVYICTNNHLKILDIDNDLLEKVDLLYEHSQYVSQDSDYIYIITDRLLVLDKDTNDIEFTIIDCLGKDYILFNHKNNLLCGTKKSWMYSNVVNSNKVYSLDSLKNFKLLNK